MVTDLAFTSMSDQDNQAANSLIILIYEQISNIQSLLSIML